MHEYAELEMSFSIPSHTNFLGWVYKKFQYQDAISRVGFEMQHDETFLERMVLFCLYSRHNKVLFQNCDLQFLKLKRRARLCQ